MYIFNLEARWNRLIICLDFVFADIADCYAMSPTHKIFRGVFARTTTLSICVLLIAVNLAIYCQTRNFDAVLVDDMEQIAAFEDGWTLRNLRNAVAPSPNHHWQPVSLMVCMAGGALFGVDPGPRHLINLVLHIGTTWLLFFFLAQATGAPWKSGAVAMLFAVHPLNVEPVAWIALHDTSLSAFFAMTSLLVYSRYVRRPGMLSLAAVFGLFVLSLLSKSVLIGFPLLLLVVDYWPLSRLGVEGALNKNGSGVGSLVKEKRLFFVFMVLWITGPLWYGWLIADWQPPATPGQGFCKPFLFLHAAVSCAGYLYKIVLPFHLAPDRYLPPFVPSPWQVSAALAVLGGITAAAVVLARRGCSYVAAGWLWFLIAMGPGVVVDAGKQALVSDRYAYFGAIGVFIVAVWGISDMVQGLRYRKAVLGLIGLAVSASLMAVSWNQARHWRDRISLAAHMTRVAPDHAEAHMLLGDALVDGGRGWDAVGVYQRLLEKGHVSTRLYNGMGVALLKIGDTQGAIACFADAIDLSPDYENAHHNMGNALLDAGRVSEAISHFKKALAINPALFETHNSLAIALAQQGELGPAVDHLKKALRINPAYRTAAWNLEKLRREVGGAAEGTTD